MTGPEHYVEAERDLRRANETRAEDATFLLVRAQVHATLAMAASQVVDDVEDEAERNAIKREWNRAIA